jgi:allantoinase
VTDGYTRRKPQRGPDHPHHGWLPLPARAPWQWPNGAAVALCPIVSLESHEDRVPDGWPQIAWLTGGVGLRPDPNIARIGARDYGLRIGFFRLVDAFAAAGLRFAVAVDALTAERHPSLIEFARRHGAEFVAHGLSVNRPLHEGLSVAEETAYIAATRQRLTAAGVHARAWFGVEYAESSRTPPLVAANGYDVICDWCNDEQPFDMTVGRPLTALPLLADLDDAFCFASPRGISAASYATRLVDAAATLAGEGRHQARVMAWHMRPFLSGQPFREVHIARAFQAVAATPGAWSATPSEVVDAWRSVTKRESPPDENPKNRSASV